MRSSGRFLHLSVLPILLLSGLCRGGERSYPAYGDRVPRCSFSPSEISLLEKGEAVFKKEMEEGGGRGAGVAAIHINANRDEVWARILRFNNYPLFMPRVKKTTLLSVKRGEGRVDYSVEFLLSILGVKVRYYIDHHYFPERGVMVWELDHTKENDIKDTVGYWVLEQVSKAPPITRALYSVKLDAGRFLPSFVEDLLGNRELPRVVRNLKEYVEKNL